MRLIRHGLPGRERPGVETEDGRRLDLGEYFRDYDEAFFAEDGMRKLRETLRRRGSKLAEVPRRARLGAPVARPSKIICVGLNYHDHARESGAEPPKEPVLFFKSTTALCGPYDPVLIPRGAKKLDWEVELGLVIGKRTKHVPEAKALSYLAGYALHNDYSERAFQLERGGQWVKGKSCDSFAPLGPWLVSREELPWPDKIDLWLDVNGERMQRGSTSQMIFKPAFLVSYISQFMTLLPGDVISTGTPAGVGLGFKPPRYLKKGDLVELGGDGLGRSAQKVRHET